MMQDWQKEQLSVATGVTDGSCKPTHKEALKLEFDALFAEHQKLLGELQAMRAVAKPEQEPVGEVYLCDYCKTPFDGDWQCPSCGHTTSTKEPVYTHPQPKREPLTDELLSALDRIVKTVPAQDGNGGFIVDHHDMDGEYLGTQQIDPMWVVQEMAAIAHNALEAHGIKGEA
jgi:hypothetical protein